jgi:non-ribosomal peptide synthetase component F
VVQGAYALLLSHYSGHRDVCFGVTVAGRPSALPGIEDTIGLFINSLPLRVRVRPGLAVRAWLSDLLDQNLVLREHEWTPLLTIQSCSELPPGEALFRSLLVYENAPIDPTSTRRGMGSRCATSATASTPTIRSR